MTDNWDDSEDEWDASDDELDARLGLNKLSTNDAAFDEEEDLAVKEKALAEKANLSDLKKKGTALQAKKREEQERAEEEELARKTMEMEAEMEANMTPEELKALKQKQVEDADHALTDDLFGGVDSGPSVKVAAADDTVVLVDLKDHLKHARKVSTAIKVRLAQFCTSFYGMLHGNVNHLLISLQHGDTYHYLLPCRRNMERFTWRLPF